MNGLRHYNDSARDVIFINRYLKIPVDLCKYAFKNKLIRPFRLYIFLLATTQGNIVFREDDFKSIAAILGYKSQKSISSHLGSLKKLNWIGYNKIQQKYWVRGLDSIRAMLKLYNRKAIEFGPEYLENFIPYCYAGIVGAKIKRQAWSRRLAVKKSGIAYQDLPSKPGYYPLANILIKKELGISLSTLSRYKMEARVAGYLDIIPTKKSIPIKTEELDTCKSNDYESFGRMYVAGRRVVEQGPDLIKVFLTFKRRKKMK